MDTFELLFLKDNLKVGDDFYYSVTYEINDTVDQHQLESEIQKFIIRIREFGYNLTSSIVQSGGLSRKELRLILTN